MSGFERMEKNEGLDTKTEFGEVFAAVSYAIERGREVDDFSEARAILAEAEARSERLTDPADQELKGQIESLIADYKRVITP